MESDTELQIKLEIGGPQSESIYSKHFTRFYFTRMQLIIFLIRHGEIKVVVVVVVVVLLKPMELILSLYYSFYIDISYLRDWDNNLQLLVEKVIFLELENWMFIWGGLNISLVKLNTLQVMHSTSYLQICFHFQE